MALGPVGTSMLYRRLGRKPPRPGEARVRPPAPSLIEREYEKRLSALVRQWFDHVETLVRAELSRGRGREDSIDDLRDGMRAAWRAVVAAGDLSAILGRRARAMADTQGRYVERVTKIPPARSAAESRLIEDFRQDHVRLISRMNAEQIEEVASIVRVGQSAGQRWEELAPQIEKRLGVAESRARLIARDQTNKFNGAVSQVKQRDAGITQYRWSTSRDLAVRGRPGGEYPPGPGREDHWSLEGKIFSWDAPPLIPGTSERAHPGQRIQCRCVAIPVVGFFQ